MFNRLGAFGVRGFVIVLVLIHGSRFNGHDDCVKSPAKAAANFRGSFLWMLGRIANHKVLLRNWISGGAEAFTNDSVGVEIDLPVVIGVAVGADSEHWAVEIELKDFDVWGGIRQSVGNFADALFERLDGFIVIHRVS